MIALRILFLAAAFFLTGTTAAQTTAPFPTPQALQECAARGNCPPGIQPPVVTPTSQGQQQSSSPLTPESEPEPPKKPDAGEPPKRRGDEAAAPEEKNDFPRFVQNSVGKELPIFGSNLFERVPTTFAPIDRVPVPVDYVIGPGDELFIR